MSLSVAIQKQLGSFHLNVRFETEAGVLALLGASGCGKSMTLKCIAGLERPDSGRIVLNGRTLFDSERRIDLPPQKRRAGYLLQQSALFPNMTVAQNLATAVRRLPKAEQQPRIAEKLAVFGLTGLEQRKPFQLSGGQQQRVALARILLSEPEILLLDEPFTALDDTIQWQLELELLELLQQYDGNAVFVSHSRDEVSRLCDRVCVLTQGRSERVMPVAELMRAPRTVSAAQLSGCKNYSTMHRDGDGVFCEAWGVRLNPARKVDDGITCVGVRAHSLHFSGAENPIPCRLTRVIDNVFSYILMLQTPGGGLLRMELEKSAWQPVPVGTALTVYLAPEALMLLKEGSDK